LFVTLFLEITQLFSSTSDKNVYVHPTILIKAKGFMDNQETFLY